MDTQSILTKVSDFMNDRVPFQRMLGFEITEFTPERGEVRFKWREDLMGNVPQRILHGGVTSTALDTAGGLVAIAGMVARLDNPSEAQLMERLTRCGTIDLRVDYLRPGRGDEFIASATIIRSGNKVAVARMELHNQDGTHIAFGTGTYLVG
ncbi:MULTISPECIES: thioesterase family protein [Idiomarina]|nr:MULTISPECIES: thioesterase family protein [Idiomarina]